MNNQRNAALDGLRCIAALSVAVGHIATRVGGTGPAYQTTIQTAYAATSNQLAFRAIHSIFNADAAVIVFFVLSGLVLTRSLSGEDAMPGATLIFVTRRVFRLFPVAIAAAVVLGLVGLATGLSTSNDPQAVLGAAFLYDTRLNGAIWTLQIELFGSAMIFGLWAIRNMMSGGAFSLCVATICIFAWTYPIVPDWPLPTCLPVMIPAFITGSLIADVPESFFNRFALAVSLTVLLFADFMLGHGVVAWQMETIAATCVVGCVYRGQCSVLEKPLVSFLGRMSYPFYLLHVAGTYVAIRLVPQIPFNYLRFVFDTVASLLVALLFARLIHVFVELPGIKLGKWVSSYIAVGLRLTPEVNSIST